MNLSDRNNIKLYNDISTTSPCLFTVVTDSKSLDHSHGPEVVHVLHFVPSHDQGCSHVWHSCQILPVSDSSGAW